MPKGFIERISGKTLLRWEFKRYDWLWRRYETRRMRRNAIVSLMEKMGKMEFSGVEVYDSQSSGLCACGSLRPSIVERGEGQ